MSGFSDKDFFGDPFWPTQVQCLQDEPCQNSQPNQQTNRSSTSKQNLSEDAFQKDQKSLMDENASNFLDIDRSFFLNEQKITSSNFKQSEITFLEDTLQKTNLNEKAYIFDPFIQQEDKVKGQMSQTVRKTFFHLDDMPFQPKYASDNDQSSSQSSEQVKIQFQPEMPTKKRPKPYYYNKVDFRAEWMISRKIIESYNLIENKNQKYEITEQYERGQQHQKNEKPSRRRSKPTQFITRSFNLQDGDEIQKNILHKLQVVKIQDGCDQNYPRQNASTLNQTTLNSEDKAIKYKILTKTQKEYLVYLSTLGSTRDVARKFNVSVNNICRWKKGCQRKVGAGRKISNQELQQEVISFVKKSIQERRSLTRKIVQNKAKQLSNNKNFKASKGWFERFFHRNLEIFRCPQNVQIRQ